MPYRENYTVEMQKYIITNGHVILFDVEQDHSNMLGQGEIITSAGLVCIWKKGNIQQVICCEDGVFFSGLSKPETDERLIAKHLDITVNSISPPQYW